MPLHSPLWEVAEPYLVALGLYSVKDPTYGRWTLPHHPPHRTLLEDEEISHTFRRLFLPPYSDFSSLHEAFETTAITYSEDVRLVPEEIKSGVEKGGRWIFYSVWEMKREPRGGWEGQGKGRGHDVVLVHGLSDYGLRYAPHVKHFLKAGFRLIIPDLPSYGYSTGINSYLPSVMLLPAALHAVLTDVVRRDLQDGIEQRKVFLCGASMGAWTVLYYLLKYPPTTSSIELAERASEPDVPPPPRGEGKGYHDGEGERNAEKSRVHASGAFVLCPAVEVAKASRPHILVELLARGLRSIAGSLPLAPAVRGNVSDDPRVEADFFTDPIGYHGWLRVGTGLSLLEGMTELENRGAEIDVPIRLVHGSHDRVTNHRGTMRLFERLKNPDKQIEIYDGYEHVMLRVGSDEADDEPRQRVLQDWRSWLLERCDA